MRHFLIKPVDKYPHRVYYAREEIVDQQAFLL